MRAAINGSIETARRHLSDKDKKNNDGDTAYTLASQAGQGAILELLGPTDEDGETALMRAAERGDVEAVRALIPLQKGRQTLRKININGVWIFRRGTALMRAASCEHAEVVRLLVDHEGGMQDSYGYTALMYAAQHGHTECVKLLAEQEAGMQDEDGWTALMKAVAGNNLECARLLAEREKDMKTTRKCYGFLPGTTALDIAKRRGLTRIISILSDE